LPMDAQDQLSIVIKTCSNGDQKVAQIWLPND
jgi:hypothetical protein